MLFIINGARTGSATHKQFGPLHVLYFSYIYLHLANLESTQSVSPCIKSLSFNYSA